MNTSKQPPIGYYRHFEGDVVLITHIATHSETGEKLAVYHDASNSSAPLEVTPLMKMAEVVEHGDDYVTRYKYLGKNYNPHRLDEDLSRPSMNIWALEGHRVMPQHKDGLIIGGYDNHKEVANEKLEIGKVYIVKGTFVGGSHTDVRLYDFPGIDFNSVCFYDVEPQSEEDDKKHSDWQSYNSQ